MRRKRFRSTIKPSKTSVDYELAEISDSEHHYSVHDEEEEFDQIELQKKNANIINLKEYKHGNIELKDLCPEDSKQSTQCCNARNSKCINLCCYSLPVLHPHGNLRISWDCIVMIILIYTCIEIPFSLAFEIKLSLADPFGALALFIDCLLLFDICLNFRTAYFDDYDHQLLIFDPPRIAKKYFRSWFLLDFITSIPFEFILPENAAGNLPSLIKILRIFRY